MNKDKMYTLINHQTGDLAFKFFLFNDNSHFDYLQRNNFYSLIWIKEGDGVLRVDFSEFSFQKNTIFSFTPYQPFLFACNKKISGVAIQYHSDFYCIHQNPTETNCDTVIFNNIYNAPFTIVDKDSEGKLNQTLEQLRLELDNTEDDDYKLLLPYLKIFLITVSRIKTESKLAIPMFSDTQVSFVLRNLQTVIEDYFKEKHTASEYAELLNISPNALSRLVKTHFNKTLTDLITERIIIQAKSELYMTSRPVKEIARELGYNDEFYFSRIFKKCTGVSPKVYRDTVGFGKAEKTP